MTDTLEAEIPDSEEAIQETRTPEQRRQDLLQERIDKATGETDEPEPEAPETEDEEDDEEEVGPKSMRMKRKKAMMSQRTFLQMMEDLTLRI